MKESVYDGLRSMQGKMCDPFMEIILRHFGKVVLYWEAMYDGFENREVYLEVVQEFKEFFLDQDMVLRETEIYAEYMDIKGSFQNLLDLWDKTCKENGKEKEKE